MTRRARCSSGWTIRTCLRATAPAFDQALTALGDVQTKLDEAEDRWLELEILREELSGERDASSAL